MIISTSPRYHSDPGEMRFVEAEEFGEDFWRWLDIPIEDSDLLVVAGLVAAQKIDVSLLDRISIDKTCVTNPLDLAKYEIPAADFSRFQKLWYHFRVPYARPSMVWWYLFCLALGRDDDVTHALRRMTEWLDLTTDNIDFVMPRVGQMLGLASGVVVVTDAELTDIAALVAAARLKAPLLAVDDVPKAIETGRNSNCDVVASSLDVKQIMVHAVSNLWLGPRVSLSALPTAASQAWRFVPNDARSDLLSVLEQRVSSIERVRLLVNETVLDNRGIARILAECKTEPVDNWPQEHLGLVTLLWCWHEGGFVLQELNQSFVSLPALTLFLVRRIREYRSRLPGLGAEQLAEYNVIQLARELRRLTGKIEQRYQRCLSFDGSNWERREFLLPLSAYRRTQEIPDSLQALWYAKCGVEFIGKVGSSTAWDQFVERALEAGSSPTRIMQEIAHWAANAQDLRVDLAIFTVPVGRKLNQPWTMDFTDLFCYVGFRDGLRPEDFGIPADRVGMYNIIAQRMRYNAVKKAQNYAPVMRFPPQGFNFPDIAVAEDANHGGHTAAGIRLACRLPITISYARHSWNGLADVRLNRAEYSRPNRFQPHDMIIGHRYTQWAQGVADATYRRGLKFDDKWANKVKDLKLSSEHR